jgi:hypothetical protein
MGLKKIILTLLFLLAAASSVLSRERQDIFIGTKNQTGIFIGKESGTGDFIIEVSPMEQDQENTCDLEQVIISPEINIHVNLNGTLVK